MAPMKQPTPPQHIAEMIRLYDGGLGWPMRELAFKFGVSVPTVHRYVVGPPEYGHEPSAPRAF
jgi:hypothetical protein